MNAGISDYLLKYRYLDQETALLPQVCYHSLMKTENRVHVNIF